MVSVVESGTPKTFLQAVQDACRMSGINEPVSVTDSDRNTVRAVLAVKQALNRIFYKTRWDWRFKWHTLEAVAGQMWYELPADFDAAGAAFGVHKSGSSLEFIGYEDLVDRVPLIRNLPPAFGNEVTEQEAVDANYNGVPLCWTSKGGYIGFWPPPSQAFIDQTSPYLIGSYYRTLVQPSVNEDELGLPDDLMPAHENISLGVFLHYREAPDWGITERAGEAMLVEAVARQRRVYWDNARLAPRS